MIKNLLTFQFGNAKLTETIATFSLPSGWTCPSANECLSKADRETGKMTDGPDTLFRCFSASQEAAFPTVRRSRWRNFELLKDAKTVEGMTDLICASLPKAVAKVRIHVAGDFFSESYFKAWVNVAWRNPNVIFYGYTKRVGLIVKLRNTFPPNFRLVASWGGKEDALILQHGLKYAKVFFTEAAAAAAGMELDHEDDHAYSTDNKPFGLLLHGTQPAGSPAAEAWKVIKRAGKGYGKMRMAARKPHLKIDLTFFSKP